MKKTFAALLMAVATPVLAACNYPLDATQAQFDLLPVLNFWQVAPIVSGQTMEFPVQETGAVGVKAFGAFSHTGVDAMTAANAASLPGGDVSLPASGIVRVQMHIDSFPWQSFSMPGAQLWLNLTIMTGNQGSIFPLPKSALEFDLSIINNSNIPGNPFSIRVGGQSISGSNISDFVWTSILTPPLSVDTGGLYFNMDTREVGVTAGGIDQAPLKDRHGNPVLLPVGVTSVALGLGGFITRVQTGEALIGAPVGATLITDICSSGNNIMLPNGNPFPGKGKALGLKK